MYDAQLQALDERQVKVSSMPSDVTDQIGGWTTDGVGQGYGSGYPMSVLKEWLVKTTKRSN
jgi:hypothetical protein